MLLSRTLTPILPLDRPWETGGTPCAVDAFLEHESGSVRLYYLVRFDSDARKNILCLARSRDLKTWEKPDCKLAGSEGTNIVFRGAGNAMDWGEFMPCRILSNKNGWTMLYWDRPKTEGNPGFCLATSPDGIHWNPVFQQPFITNANDAGSLIDRRASGPTPFGGSYFLYQQTWQYNPGLPQDRDNLKSIHRRISIWTSDRLDGRWIGPVTVLEPGESDPPDVQFY
jgi:hypothetical protein